MDLLNKSRLINAALLIGVLGLASATLYALDTSQRERNQNDLLNSSGIPEKAPASPSMPDTPRADQLGNPISER